MGLSDVEATRLWNSVKKFYRKNYKRVDTSNHGVKCKIIEYKPIERPKMTFLNELFRQTER